MGNLTHPLVGVGAHSVGHILATSPPDSLVSVLGHLLADLLGHLATRGSGLADKRRRVKLEGQVHGQGQEQRGSEDNLHLRWMEDLD